MLNVIGVLAAVVVSSITPTTYDVAVHITQDGQSVGSPRLLILRDESAAFLREVDGHRLKLRVTPSAAEGGQIKLQVNVEASIPGHVRQASTTVTLGSDHHIAIKLAADGADPEVDFDINVSAVSA
jgi:uncharacterized protein YfaS (alpha-2-macroglobulin family)